MPASDSLIDRTTDPVISAYNHCPTCGLRTIQAKFCPFCGPEMNHVPAAEKCLFCNEQVTFKDAKFCGWCGLPLGAKPDA